MSTSICPLGCNTPLTRHCPETNVMCKWATCPKCKITLDVTGWRAFDNTGKQRALPPRTP